MAKQPKGTEGKKTGSSAREAIEQKVRQGMTLEEIGRGVNRDGSTISDIRTGEIKNPPSGLAQQIRNLKARFVEQAAKDRM